MAMTSAAEQARDEAIDRVEMHAPDVWKHWAAAAMNKISKDRPDFTADDVWDQLDQWGVARPREPRALAAVFRYLANIKVIEPTARWSASRRVSRHAGPVRVWRRVSEGGWSE